MRYKHMAIVGGTLIFVVFVLAGLMYYFNQDQCPVGTFPCQNSTICVPQRGWCDGSPDCPEGDDENLDCFDSHGYWGWLAKPRERKPHLDCGKLNYGSVKTCLKHIFIALAVFIYFTLNNDIDSISCPSLVHSHLNRYLSRYFHLTDPNDCPKGCTCGVNNTCSIVCYKEIPQTLFPNVTSISLRNYSPQSIPSNALTKYIKIRALYAVDNNISRIEEGAFINQAELTWLFISGNALQEIRPGQLAGLSSLETLQASNNSLRVLDLTDFENSTALEYLFLSYNLLSSENLKLPYLPALTELVLDHNKFDKLTEHTFSKLPMLGALNLQGNHICIVDSNTFRSLTYLTELNLEYNGIIAVPPGIFQSNENMSKLMIGYNPIENLPAAVFDPLRNLQSLGLEEIDMDSIVEKNVFDLFNKLEFVYFKKFHYCTTYAPKVQKCRPASDGVSSLSHLLGKPLLRAAVWGISAVTCLGNALVLWGRFTAKDENRVLSIVIRNLAVSDMLMGFYLLIIALEDVRFRHNYNLEASSWMSSWSCTLVGILAMTSSEVSVMILSFMSVERFMLIAAPLRRHRGLTPQAAFSSMIIVWVIGIILALIPAIHWRSSTRYYGANGMCFPLHIDDPFLVGWEYSAFIFLGLNLVGLVIIGYVYAGMFASIWRTRHNTPLSVGDSEFAFRFFLIVLTDAVCWAPIIALKILAFRKYPVPPDLHAWVVVFILPVNSAINPLLYTFTTPKFRERLSEGWIGRMRNYVSRKHSVPDSQLSTSTTGNKNLVIALTGVTNEIPIHKRIPPITKFHNDEEQTASITPPLIERSSYLDSASQKKK